MEINGKTDYFRAFELRKNIIIEMQLHPPAQILLGRKTFCLTSLCPKTTLKSHIKDEEALGIIPLCILIVVITQKK
jgi:hypothetical protein